MRSERDPPGSANLGGNLGTLFSVSQSQKTPKTVVFGLSSSEITGNQWQMPSLTRSPAMANALPAAGAVPAAS